MLWIYETETLKLMFADAMRVASSEVNSQETKMIAEELAVLIREELANRGVKV
jgi:hypothetical protein